MSLMKNQINSITEINSSSNIYFPMSQNQQFFKQDKSLQKISHVDQLLQKNQRIYKNLRQKLQGITKAQRNITNNINYIRPLTYSKNNQYENKNTSNEYQTNGFNFNPNSFMYNYNPNQIYDHTKITSNYQNNHFRNNQNNNNQQINIKNLNIDLIQFDTNNNSKYQSSPIQKQKYLNQSPKRLFNNDNNTNNNEKQIKIIKKQSSKQFFKLNRVQSSQNNPYNNQKSNYNYLKQNKSLNNIYQPINNPYSKKNSIYIAPTISNDQIHNNFPRSQNDRILIKQYLDQRDLLINSQLKYQKLSKSSYIKDLQNISYHELSKRKNQIEKIYLQLKQQQEKIQKEFQQYKKNMGYSSSQSLHENKNVGSKILENDEMKSSFQQNNKNQQNILISTHQNNNRNKQLKKVLSNKKSNESRKRISNNIRIQNPIQSPQRISRNTESHLKKSKKSQSSSIKKAQSSIKKNIPVRQIRETINSKQKVTNFDNDTSSIQHIEVSYKPQFQKAKCHIFIPFNKLYKSPILQLKSSNVLILARQSKLTNLRTQQNKIIDGKKYKFTFNIQTDQQNLIKNVLKAQTQNNLAIIGGQSTLKKKLHMAFIAHSFDKIQKILYSSQLNYLTLNISYCQFVDKPQIQQIRIQNSAQIRSSNQIKISILKIQKTIEQIYQTIKKIPSGTDSNFTKNPTSSQINQKYKVLRQTKISILSGKQIIYECKILSINQYNLQFLKTLQVKDIIWSINPLVKNYEEVAKTLNQIVRYQQAINF